MKKLNHQTFASYPGARKRPGALPHLTRGICTAIIAGFVAWVPQAGAVSFTGVSSGVFVNPTGGPGLVTTGVNTNLFTWGTGFNSPPSVLGFTGKSFASIVPEQVFTIGNLSYFNGEVWDGTQAYSVGLQAKLAFTSPSQTSQNFNYNFLLTNTPNTTDPWASADSVWISSFLPTTSFNVDGVVYTLKMWFGSVTGPGLNTLNEFRVQEYQQPSVSLLGKITAIGHTSVPTSVPDSGSTLALMAMAVVGLGGLRQYLTCKA